MQLAALKNVERMVRSPTTDQGTPDARGWHDLDALLVYRAYYNPRAGRERAPGEVQARYRDLARRGAAIRDRSKTTTAGQSDPRHRNRPGPPMGAPPARPDGGRHAAGNVDHRE